MHQRSIRSLTALVGLACLSLAASSLASSTEHEQAYTWWKTALANNAARYALRQGIIATHLPLVDPPIPELRP